MYSRQCYFIALHKHFLCQAHSCRQESYRTATVQGNAEEPSMSQTKWCFTTGMKTTFPLVPLLLIETFRSSTKDACEPQLSLDELGRSHNYRLALFHRRKQGSLLPVQWHTSSVQMLLLLRRSILVVVRI